MVNKLGGTASCAAVPRCSHCSWSPDHTLLTSSILVSTMNSKSLFTYYFPASTERRLCYQRWWMSWHGLTRIAQGWGRTADRWEVQHPWLEQYGSPWNQASSGSKKKDYLGKTDQTLALFLGEHLPAATCITILDSGITCPEADLGYIRSMPLPKLV